LRSFVPLEQAARAYHDIDIALDPFPFCGGMTSFESLWMGVPVVTLEQPLIAGRQTLAMLRNLGQSEWIARDEAQYVAIATGLAGDIDQLAAIRRELRPQFAASPLADYDGFARDFTTALRGMWRRWAKSNPSTGVV
jgi:protein O-GlcNAc transferase